MHTTAKRLAALTAAALLATTLVPDPAAAAIPDYSTAEAGNPFVDGWYADPDVAVYNNTFWVYPTTSKGYSEQTYLDAFSSTDLVTWTKHPNVLTKADVAWAGYAMWAPAPVQRDGRYYLYFAANDIQSNSALGGIGVAVADNPAGPFRDAIGRPLIGQFFNGAQPIDQDVFIDDDGQAYIYYGGWGHANVAKLNADMVSLGTFSDGSTFKEITPAGYVEGPQMFKRNGRYYLMWSEGGWTGPDYSVSYAMSSSPTGPFTKLDKVLAQDPAVAKGSGHNSVINVPGTDTWYILYHRRPLSETDGNHRQLAYDRMTFNADGTIQRIVMRVKDNFADGNALGWRTFGGSWGTANGRYTAGSSLGGKAQLDTNFGDFSYDADVSVTSGGGDAGLTFRVTNPTTGTDGYNGYYAGISPAGRVVLGRAANNWTQLGAANLTVTTGTSYHLRVTAIGSSIKVYVDDLATPKINVTDGTYASGSDGVRVFNAAATFDNVVVGAPVGAGVNVAQGRPATGTTPCAASEGPEKAVNGSVSGGNADKFCSSVAGAWLQVDLGGARSISRFELAHAQAGGEAASMNTRAFTISVSNDGASWTQVVNVTGNTAANTTHPVSGVTGRYVRLNVGTPTQTTEIATRIYELRVFS
ncbi:family 43 glycosylhydrolase [Dactylosporangium aurantiacum]|uniref:family 43 glycosylhydrolase n=1 Tax=Dactylosporangium aurantiacum TaxID=35754 RepID=UPI000B247695|nr:family 43 glycosylhydrolase [Dactylosporangium aurantiacum]MDG6107374.1 family 43 glycosylhydrolase [Dactylosporangium aurantiacum]